MATWEPMRHSGQSSTGLTEMLTTAGFTEAHLVETDRGFCALAIVPCYLACDSLTGAPSKLVAFMTLASLARQMTITGSISQL